MNARWLSIAVLAALLLSLPACRKREPDREVKAEEADLGPDWFQDITTGSGIDHTYRNGEDTADHLSILESLGGGVGLIDFDGDGLLDVFLTGGGGFAGKDKKEIIGRPCKLYRNLGGGKFKDVTAEAGLDKLAGGLPWFYTHGVAVADYDRDGWPDLLVTGWGRVALFRNVPVDRDDPKKGRRFEDVSEKAKLDKGITWATSAAWGDLDGDGYPDLYVCQYVDWSWQNNPSCDYDGKTPDVCPPKRFSGLKHKVFRNNGDGTFADQTESSGLLPGGREASKGLGVLMIDLDGDGKPDVYVCNDTVDKFLYHNVSKPGRIRFDEQGMISGAARDDKGSPNGSMGVDAGDYDHRGKPAIWVTNYENELHSLYRNESGMGQMLFTFQTHRSGIAALGQNYVGWGTGFVDFDLDGWEDLLVANGHAIRSPKGKATRKQKPVLMRNKVGKFEPITRLMGSYGQADHLARGVGFGDIDNDGRVDLVISHLNEPAAVLKNVAGEGRHWLGVHLVGKGNACTVGSRVILEADGQTQTRFGKGGGSYCSSNDRRMVFGLGNAVKVDKLTVRWPDGSTSEHKNLMVDRYQRIEQGAK
jgi:hypothetical protein